jgi:CheY-like chemotaxis protein
MRVLMAEDDADTAVSYKKALQQRNHTVLIADNGEDCLKIYHEEFQKITSVTDATDHLQPFDAVVLDYKMPEINGMEVAKEILVVNPRQRIIFASAYVMETLQESVKQLKQVVELMQKPFGPSALIDTIEDKEIYSELQKLDMDANVFKRANFRHEQLREVLELLRKLQKGKTF